MRAILYCAALAALLASACGKSSGAPDAGPVLTDAGCYLNPVASVEIINACTDAGFVDKSPLLPLLLPDGGLPPLP
jgi:hypothetical protein